MIAEVGMVQKKVRGSWSLVADLSQDRCLVLGERRRFCRRPRAWILRFAQDDTAYCVVDVRRKRPATSHQRLLLPHHGEDTDWCFGGVLVFCGGNDYQGASLRERSEACRSFHNIVSVEGELAGEGAV